VSQDPEQQEGQDPTEVPEDDPSQQSTERDRVEQERKLSRPEDAEGGEAGQDEEENGEEQPPEEEEQRNR
jgi:hypothetical protein